MTYINVEDYYRCHIIYNNLRGARVIVDHSALAHSSLARVGETIVWSLWCVVGGVGAHGDRW